jgi:hypothetical protein
MGTDGPTPIVLPVHCAPKKAPCPNCGKKRRRKRTLTRTVRTVASTALPHKEEWERLLIIIISLVTLDLHWQDRVRAS